MSPHARNFALPCPRSIGAKAVVATTVLALVASVTAVSSVADAATASTTQLAPVADSYVTSAAPRLAHGKATRLQVSNQRGHHKVAYLRFRVPAYKGKVITGARLVLTRDSHHLGTRIYANAIKRPAWSESRVSAHSAPKLGALLSSTATSNSTKTVSLNVLHAVHPNAVANIALTARNTKTFASFRSREWGAGAPRLVLTLRTTPVSKPPARKPPVSKPPVSKPPVSKPPVSKPPVSKPPVSKPPVSKPPVSKPPVPGPGSCVSNAMGIPSSGAYVGAAVSGTADLPTLERQAGRPLALHRNYFSASQVDYAITSVKADLAAGRLPWISFKMPYSWADMANGRGDAWATDLADKLAKVGGPVWLAFHHEPEGDGPIQDWVRMQQHLAPIVHAHAKNVAYSIIIMSWDLFGDAQYRPDKIWPGDKYVDILGIDMYNDYGANRHGNTTTPMLDPMKYLGWFGTFAKAHHVPIALGETGYTTAAAGVDPTWLKVEYQNLVAQGGIGLAYFDSSLNSIADWTLDVPSKIQHFSDLVKQSPRICG